MTVAVSVNGGHYNSSQTVSLTTNKPETIYYTTNGTTPTSSSPVYINSVVIIKSTVLKYFKIDLDGNTSTIPHKLSLSMNDNGTIYYTLNGKTPTKPVLNTLGQ